MATILLLFIPASLAMAQPAAPTELVARPGDGSVILHWHDEDVSNLKGYRIYRATDEAGPFEQPVPAVFVDPHFVDFNVENGQSYFYRVRAVDEADLESEDSAIVQARPDVLIDEAFLDLVQQTAIDYFWYEANPSNGLIKDRNTPDSPASIAAVGFGLSALTVGVDRGWITREAARTRVFETLDFFWRSEQSDDPEATGYKGFYYHFLDMQTGRRAWNSELSTIDTALLLGGVLHVGAYFDGDDPIEDQIRSLADSIYRRVEWDWAQPRPPRIGHGWRPESGFIPFDWGGYNEAMIVYLLALGSPTHPVSESAWSAWTGSYTWGTYYGHSFVVFPPLFGHQYTHVWFDFRGIQDTYMRGRGIDYFENSRRATLANRAYAIDNPKGWAHYNENIWGLTASDVPGGYAARGAPPAQNDDGTIAPTAPGGSFPFTPDESLAALRYMYATYKTQVWWRYGFRDAFNPALNWFAAGHLGIDQGPIALMIENHRSGRVWDVFMQIPAVQVGLERAGFVRGVNRERDSSPEEGPSLTSYPNPLAGHTRVLFTVMQSAHVELSVFDVLGRELMTVESSFLPRGRHESRVDLSGLPAGVYFLVLTQPAARQVEKILLIRE